MELVAILIALLIGIPTLWYTRQQVLEHRRARILRRSSTEPASEDRETSPGETGAPAAEPPSESIASADATKSEDDLSWDPEADLLLRTLADSSATAIELSHAFGMHEQKVRFILEELKKQGLVQGIPDHYSGARYYRLTHEGRRVLFERGDLD